MSHMEFYCPKVRGAVSHQNKKPSMAREVTIATTDDPHGSKRIFLQMQRNRSSWGDAPAKTTRRCDSGFLVYFLVWVKESTWMLYHKTSTSPIAYPDISIHPLNTWFQHTILVSKIKEVLWRFVKLSVELLDLDIPMKFQQINCFHDITVPRNEKSPDQLGPK